MSLTAYYISENFNFELNKICQLKRLYCFVNATGSQMDSAMLYNILATLLIMLLWDKAVRVLSK